MLKRGGLRGKERATRIFIEKKGGPNECRRGWGLNLREREGERVERLREKLPLSKSGSEWKRGKFEVVNWGGA